MALYENVGGTIKQISDQTLTPSTTLRTITTKLRWYQGYIDGSYHSYYDYGALATEFTIYGISSVESLTINYTWNGTPKSYKINTPSMDSHYTIYMKDPNLPSNQIDHVAMRLDCYFNKYATSTFTLVYGNDGWRNYISQPITLTIKYYKSSF